MVKIEIINRSKHALPEYATELSAGCDLRADLPRTTVLGSLQRALIPTGLYLALPEGYEAQVRLRSGLAYREGLTVLNSPGTIDADYRGEIKVLLINLSNQSIEIRDGDRIAQMVITKHEVADFHAVEVLSSTARGSGGFGSTGKNN
ncbi:MAG TPA: dUTP diphosphatase [Cryomorphaceae bacterium]|nr:dUTP diphosphatase [Cryomorphaceae bacterium]